MFISAKTKNNQKITSFNFCENQNNQKIAKHYQTIKSVKTKNNPLEPTIMVSTVPAGSVGRVIHPWKI